MSVAITQKQVDEACKVSTDEFQCGGVSRFGFNDAGEIDNDNLDASLHGKSLKNLQNFLTLIVFGVIH